MKKKFNFKLEFGDLFGSKHNAKYQNEVQFDRLINSCRNIEVRKSST